MAFPLPDHLPKRPTLVDVSSKILYKIDAATNETLNSDLASSWIRELDETIQSTKQHIHDRIQSDLPKFLQQLETSKSVQAQFRTLTSDVDNLNDVLSNPESGILPTLVDTLTKHATLAQEASDAEAIYEAFSCLLQCRNGYSSLVSLISDGKLPDAVTACEDVQQLLERVPESLSPTTVMEDLRQRFRASKARIEDQLSDVYWKSVIVSPTELIIHPLVQVRQSDTILEISSVFKSLSPASLSNHLGTLRRDLLIHFVDHVLKQPYSVSIETSNINELKLALIPAPPNTEDLASRLDNLSEILDFLSIHLLSKLPHSDAVLFSRSLSKPITSSVLNNLLMPSLPSSFGLLPFFLALLKRAVAFEETHISKLLADDRNEGLIKAWSNGVSGHYERRRRIEILELSRKEILEPEVHNDTFQAVSFGGPETSLPSVVPVQADEDFKDDAWGFDEPASAKPVEEPADNWGFDDDMDVEPDGEVEPEEEAEPQPEPQPETPTIEKMTGATGEENDDPTDAWGWNEKEDIPVDDIPEEDNAWDDPWSDSGETNVQPEPPSPVRPTSVTSPKAATRLEKLASKNKKHLNGSPIIEDSHPSSPPVNGHSQHITISPPSPEPVLERESKIVSKSGRLNAGKRPADVMTTVMPKEFYQVPKRAKRVIRMVETVIDESKLFYASNLFPASKETSHAPGTILLQSASSILDLYRALYPVNCSKDLELPERGMLFANSCFYMTGAVQRIEDTLYGESILKERLTECRRHLQILGDSWFHETTERQRQVVDKILVDGAQGFAYTGDQDRYDDCETAVNQVLKDIKRLSQKLKGILAKSKYYAAIGSVADAALSRVLQGVLELPDIPELESHRLSELCRILNALEGLFCEDPAQPSFVVAYVPTWLKFSYLSELLEASLADITYLFEQRALVDFEVGELVNLVRALFADTALRTNTINKLLAGHPAPPQ
ncbi:hypothetical protein B0H34DRAFT_654458 [Crassisporium funariophilum]|nr:hypothetical protein B0H34DRAFT_654458 [Crassisporium funariophilum]